MKDILNSFFGSQRMVEKVEIPVNGEPSGFIHERYLVPLILTITLSVALLSCDANKIPDNVLTKDEMSKILTEFYLKEARLNALHVDADSTQKLMQLYRFEYTKQIGIPDSIVELSYRYYMEHPKDMSEIYDRIIDTLGLKEQRINSGGPRKIE